MDTNRLKRFATEARNILMQGVVHRLTALGFLPDGSLTEEPQQQGGGATFMGDTVTQGFYNKWQSLRRAVSERKIEDVAEEAAYTWFNRLVAIRIMVKNGLASPVLEYESDDVFIPILVSEARQGRIPQMDDDSMRKLTALLDDDSKTNEQFALLIVAYCHSNPVINSCFGHISDYTELLLPANILTEGGFVHMLNNTEFISEDDFKSPELIGWLYQFYISEKKDFIINSGKKATAEEIPARTQLFTPNWIVRYMVQNSVGRMYLDNNPYSSIKESMEFYMESKESTPSDAIFRFDDIHELTVADLACGSGHILNECFDLLYQLYIEEGYSRKKAIEDIFKYNLTGVDLDTRAKQLAQFALLLKACQKEPSFADAHCMPKVLDMPKPYDAESVSMSLDSACLKFMGGYETVAGEMLEQDMELLMDANNLGSIMQFNDDEDYLAMLQYHYDDWTDGGVDDCPEEIQALIPGVELILTLTKKYASLVMNPPYMGSSYMNTELKKYVFANFPNGKYDLFSAFMYRCNELLLPKGCIGYICPYVWMFIASFENYRKDILKSFNITSLVQLEYNAFEPACVPICTFTLSKTESRYLGSYIKLSDFKGHQNQAHKTLEAISNKDCGWYYNINQTQYNYIPGMPIAYWVSETLLDAFRTGKPISQYSDCKSGLSTGDNGRFIRLWFEESREQITFNCKSQDDYLKSGKKYVPIASGGTCRRWYGNLDSIINWSLRDEMHRPGFTKMHLYYIPGICWNAITAGLLSCRAYGTGMLFEHAVASLFANDGISSDFMLGYINTKVFQSILTFMNPTMNNGAEVIGSIPVLFPNDTKPTANLAKKCTKIAKQDWDAHETSWDFVRNELLTMDGNVLFDNINYQAEQHFKKTGEHICIDPAPPMSESVEWCYDMYCGKWERMFMQLHENEEELNRQFIEIYGLQDELTPDVPLDEITILQQGEVSINENANDDDDRLIWHSDVVMKQLISYAVGCMMGRYSIDAPGLILANQGDGQNEYNAKVPDSRFGVDDDGIIPLMACDTDFADNATLRFKQWLTVAFGDEKLVENLNFIEGALGKSLDDYFVKDFWKDHKKMYQNRPIYWLFASKKGAFQCIAYMHRMNAYTTERIRTKYLLPHIEWLMQKQSEMEENAANLSTAERKKLDSIRKQIDECREYHDRLHVVADEQIAFDLDDGVVVNYAKFGDVLAKLK